jgi:uncharacterized membrane protein YcaP (DUF421 family)
MKQILFIFRESTHLSLAELVVRSIVVFFVALIILRIAGKRTFGKQSPSDNVIMIMLGAVLSRAIVGASPFLPVIAGSFAIVMVHRLLAWLSFGNNFIGNLVKGKVISLYKNGKEDHANMKRTLVTHDDMLEGVRLQIDSNLSEEIEEILIERNGQISVVKKK